MKPDSKTNMLSLSWFCGLTKRNSIYNYFLSSQSTCPRFPWDFPPDYSKLGFSLLSVTEETNDECLQHKRCYWLCLKSNLYRFSDFLIFTSSDGKIMAFSSIQGINYGKLQFQGASHTLDSFSN